MKLWQYVILFTGCIVGFETTQQENVSANSVNDYIYSKNFQAKNSSNYIQQWLNNPNWEGVDMNYRHGSPEGVLVHETANSSDKNNPNAIWNEINYMLGHAESAFVHSFVDDSSAIEIANPSFKSWGAGAEGNRRFIQTEQVQVEGKEAFAQELFNLAVLQSRYLATYNLRPSLGNTVWSHAMVSQQLGGTNHTDPDGYWADMAARFYGTTYTMNDYESLLENVYNKITPHVTYARPVDYVATISVENSSGAGIDKNQPYLIPGSEHFGWAKDYNHQLVHITQEMTTSNTEVVWVSFKLNGITVYMQKDLVKPGAFILETKPVNYTAHIDGINSGSGIDEFQ
ncbi:N-acetylmuramoyl-L-alanine amidase, partial [Weissella diestrammenae]